MTDAACRHFEAYKVLQHPRCNCTPCWFKYFNANRGRVRAVLSSVSMIGVEKTVAVLGTKYMKMLRRFLETHKP